MFANRLAVLALWGSIVSLLTSSAELPNPNFIMSDDVIYPLCTQNWGLQCVTLRWSISLEAAGSVSYCLCTPAGPEAFGSLVLQGERPAGSAAPPASVQTSTVQHREQLGSRWTTWAHGTEKQYTEILSHMLEIQDNYYNIHAVILTNKWKLQRWYCVCVVSSEPPQQQQPSCGSEQWEQTARTTADSYNETQSSPAAVTKTERHVLASKPPRAAAPQVAPTSGKVTLLFPRISSTPQGFAFKRFYINVQKRWFQIINGRLCPQLLLSRWKTNARRGKRRRLLRLCRKKDNLLSPVHMFLQPESLRLWIHRSTTPLPRDPRPIQQTTTSTTQTTPVRRISPLRQNRWFTGHERVATKPRCWNKFPAERQRETN